MLKAAGHDIVAVRFLLWSDPLAPAIAEILPSKCCTAQNAARAKKTADALSIPYHIVDLSEEFKREVVDPYLRAHQRGLTPNPCIGCNRTMKFGKLIELMKMYGCEKIATGHYARIACGNAEEENVFENNRKSKKRNPKLHRSYEPFETSQDRQRGISNQQLESRNPKLVTRNPALPAGRPQPATYHLLEASDPTKDQSYYLYGLSQEQLQYCLFPLGGMRKSEVYALARSFGVPFDDESYRESQDLCFFPEKTPQAFLRRHLSDSLSPGPILRRDGTVVGSHEGLPLYTIGQRRGLGIGGLKIPLEVVAKDIGRNALVVANRATETCTEVHVGDLAWISWKPEEEISTPFACKTRSLSTRRHGTFTCAGDRGTFYFADPQPPVTPGQSLVLYRGSEIIGGGMILEGI